ncbi:dihydroorotate dehydrogenase-like protein [Methylomarinum sp. Ch1-1]|uniref:Dihydroorotate dehydrogenase-like protein n=1 Tax=Methylomarinum roseum TaxID=3067653 RepID=A0AAU7NZS6_9GAMM|nr:dihydroorotate dehydrogenase-like protein [Methylomarinum sp. Ch1-1]MDP4521799.1 dihydroorotate dehydrogenase-like protein [Methylomarinum sp. Ch1-1]
MDLSTRYLGLDLKHPIIASSTPLSETLDGIRLLEDSGASAIVMFSLFEEQIRRENEAFDFLLESGTESFAESLNYFPHVDRSPKGPEHYLNLISKAVAATEIPIIGSLNGVTNEGWIDYAKQIQDAGAHALELNVYFIPTDLELSPAEVEQRYFDILQAVKASVSIPVAIKLSPFFSAIGNMAKRLAEAGADGLVLFNRFYQPDFDLERLQVDPRASLSTAEEIRLPLLWIAVLYGRINTSLAGSRGVHSATEVIKYLLAGADVVMVASALMKHGPNHLQVLFEGLEQWLEARDYQSLDEVKGVMSRLNAANPGAFERVNYIKVLESFEAPQFPGA